MQMSLPGVIMRMRIRYLVPSLLLLTMAAFAQQQSSVKAPATIPLPPMEGPSRLKVV